MRFERRFLAALLALLPPVLACSDGAEPPVAQPSTTPRVTRLPGATFRLAALGDFGTGGEFEYAVSEEMERWDEAVSIDALVTTGDNIYPDGHQSHFEDAWSEPFDWAVGRDLPVLATLGNHDVQTGEGLPVLRLFEAPGRYYEEEIGRVEVFLLDSNRVESRAQVEWLEERLEAADGAWQIVAFHHPPYSCSEHGDSVEVQETWLPVFLAEGVDLVLSGHDHNYQRFARPDEPPYVVTGGGGANLYGLGECSDEQPERVTAHERHHFLLIEGSDERLVVRALAPDGSTLDEFDVDPRS